MTPRYALGALVTLACMVSSEGLVFGAAARQARKARLLDLIQSGADDGDILAAVKDTEALNPVLPFQSIIASPLLSDNWLMVYTTSGSIAGRNRPKLLQTEFPPEQLIDVASAKAVNSELVIGIRNSVEASLSPFNSRRVDVKFDRFKIGPFTFDAPDTLTGFLEVSYLDDTLRISRGDKGNVFVLLRQTERDVARDIWRGWKRSWTK
mmetsp:Transcript_34073/g.76957  ORF Transcript_34073/g.76957 Transcript_34073/m.76957 type:complete len:208 (+) Transcript_34073:87-710(+)